MTTNIKYKAEKEEAFEIVIKTEPKKFQNSSGIDKTFKLTNIKSEIKHKDSKSHQTENKICKFCVKYFAIKNNLIKHQHELQHLWQKFLQNKFFRQTHENQACRWKINQI